MNLFYLLPIEKKRKEKKEHFNDHEIHWHKVMSIGMSRKSPINYSIK